MSKEKVIDAILGQTSSKNYESIRSDLHKNSVNSYQTDLNKTRRRVNKFSITNHKLDAFMLDTPPGSKHAYKASFQAKNEFELSPPSNLDLDMVINQQSRNDRREYQTVISDFVSPDVLVANNGQKLSSTAAFKTLGSSINKPTNLEYVPTESPISTHSHQLKEIVPCQTPNLPKFTDIYSPPQHKNHHPVLSRKPTNSQMVVVDEGHSEPFEIIESMDCQKFQSKIDGKKIDFDTPELKPIKESKLVSDKENIFEPELESGQKFKKTDFYVPKSIKTNYQPTPVQNIPQSLKASLKSIDNPLLNNQMSQSTLKMSQHFGTKSHGKSKLFLHIMTSPHSVELYNLFNAIL